MTYVPTKSVRHFTEAARTAGLAARKAKAAEPDDFGVPKLFIVRVEAHAYTWELRRFGGVVLQRGEGAFVSMDAARASGERALATLCTSPDLMKFERQTPRLAIAERV